MAKNHQETAWAILIVDPKGFTKFVTMLNGIAMVPTRAKCEWLRKEWRRISKDKRRAKIVRVRIDVI